ncbi:MAG: hypothetical protein JWR17_3912 [Pseudomonas sp.]|jgi:hypothetical protein|nr:hypothetical protein [Pseudomonas sp.]
MLPLCRSHLVGGAPAFEPDTTPTCRSQRVGERFDAVYQARCLANNLAPTANAATCRTAPFKNGGKDE